MKKIRTLMILAVTLILTFSVSGLTGPSLAEAPKPAKIVVKGSHEVAKGCSVSLEASVRPAEASQKVRWESSDKTIAKVSKSGKVTGLKAGNVTITVTSAENPAVRKKWDICIRSKPVRKLKLSASTDTLYLDIRKTAQIIVTKSPVSASDTLVWKSSNKKIATVSASGLVTAKKAGTVTITASTVDGSGKEASITFTVKKKAPVFPDPDPDKPINYYALIIGNSDYTEITKLPSVKRDVRAIKGALSSMSQHWKVTVKQNLTSGQIASAVSSAFKGATDNDICLFFYSGHGMEDMDFEPGALMGITYSGDSQETDLLSASRLRSLLDKACPGKVIVMLEACGSGAVIYDGQELSWELNSGKRFTNAVVSAFRGAVLPNTGELLSRKYTVLTTCEHGDYGVLLPVAGKLEAGLLTYCTVKALGCNYPDGSVTGSMSADANGDHRLTLGELKPYADKRLEEIKARFPGDTTQVFQYFGDNDMVLFER